MSASQVVRVGRQLVAAVGLLGEASPARIDADNAMALRKRQGQELDARGRHRDAGHDHQRRAVPAVIEAVLADAVRVHLDAVCTRVEWRGAHAATGWSRPRRVRWAAARVALTVPVRRPSASPISAYERSA